MSTKTTAQRRQFTSWMRVLHGLTAAMVLTMLGMGVAMVVSLGNYHGLVSIHRPLGILILMMVAVRYVNRYFFSLPPFSNTMSSQERFVASAFEQLFTRFRLCFRWLAGACCRRRAIQSYCMRRFGRDRLFARMALWRIRAAELPISPL